MIRILGFYRRLPHLTHEQFRDEWRRHGAMIRGAPDVTKYMRKYVQHHLQPASAALTTTTPLDYDGFSECWCDSIEAYKALRAEPSFAEIGAHTGEFIDVAEIRIMLDEPATSSEPHPATHEDRPRC